MIFVVSYRNHKQMPHDIMYLLLILYFHSMARYNQIFMSNSIELRAWNLFWNDYFIYSLLTQYNLSLIKYDKKMIPFTGVQTRYLSSQANEQEKNVWNLLLCSLCKKLRKETTSICRYPYTSILFVQCNKIAYKS